jgi:hypothetical protein
MKGRGAEIPFTYVRGSVVGVKRDTGWPHVYMPLGEGVSWIRGHHADDSPEALAMLVAWALGFEGAE